MTKPQQDAKGRFAHGNKLSKGRPPAATQRERLEALLSVCGEADWRAVCVMAVKQARRGDRYARQWLAAYLLPAAGAAGLTENSHIEIELYSGYANGGYKRAVAAIAARPGWVRVALCQLIVRRIPAVVNAAQRNARLGCRLSGVVRDLRRCTRR